MSTTSNVPSGFKQALSKFDSVFDKETLLDDDKELWLIRIPDNVSEEDVAGMKIKMPSNKATKKALGKLEKNNDKYAMYKVPTSKDLREDTDEEDLDKEHIDVGISGHEMLSFDCLVPSREDNGKLVFAPKNFDQYLILNQIVDIPDSTTLAQSILDKPVYKRDQPEGLQMRFKPYGYYSEEKELVTEDTKMVETDTAAGKRKRVPEEDDSVVEKKAKKDKKVKKEKKAKKEKKQ